MAPPATLREFQLAFTGYLRDPGHQRAPAGLARRGPARIYADIVANNMESQVSACFPIARAVLGKRRWRALIRDFLVTHDCRTPYFHEVPDEFLFYLLFERGPDDRTPPFLSELAHYEWSEMVLAIDASPGLAGLDAHGDLARGIPILNPVLALSDYRYPVHLLGPRYQPDIPPPQATHILAFRDLAYQVRFLCLNPVTLQLFAILWDGQLTGRDAVCQIVRDMDLPDPDAAIAGGLAILADLRDQGAILGVRSTANREMNCLF